MIFRYKNFSIKHKLLAIQLLPTFIIIILFSLFYIAYNLHLNRGSLMHKLDSMARLIGSNSVSSLLFLDQAAAEEVLSSLAVEEDIENAWILDADGKLFTSYQKNQERKIPAPQIMTESIEFHSDHIFLSRKIISQGRMVGMVLLRSNMDRYRRSVNHYLFLAFMMLAAGMVLAYFLSNLFQKRISRPILKLVDAANEVTRTRDFSLRLEAGMKDEIGALYSAFNNMMSELTRRERERDEAEEIIRSQRRQLQQILDTVGSQIWYLNTEARIINCNLAAKNTVKEIAGIWGKTMIEIPLLWDDPKRRHEENLKVIRTGRPLMGLIENVRIGDQARTMNVDKVPSFDEQGKINGLVIFMYDITKRQQAEDEIRKLNKELEHRVELRTQELSEANERLKELDRLKSMFMASMSHELRTPLNSIIGFTGLLLMKMAGELNDEQSKQLGLVKKNAHHLLSLINDILDISKIESGRIDTFIEEFDLSDVIGEVIASVTPLAEAKGLKLVRETPEKIAISSDKKRVKQVLLNLLSNAIKFTERGQVSISAYFSPPDSLVVTVSDTGIGIKKSDMDKLFKPFSQIDMSSARKYEGTGLGLYLCKKIVALLKGDLTAESLYGRGSTMQFILPLIIGGDESYNTCQGKSVKND